ncbi:MAG: hypothetical protein NWQ26_03785 [Paraglaciecola sp.]|nr:hypothetical protein [Paraglaciecola sp.]
METAVIILITVLLLILISAPAWLMWYAAESLLPRAYCFSSAWMTVITLVLALITSAIMSTSAAIQAAEGLMSVLVYSIIWSSALIPLVSLGLFLFKRQSDI